MSETARALGAELATTAGAAVPVTVTVEVIDVTDAGVNVMSNGALLTDVPCLASYRTRAPGDWVVMRPGARPLVLGRTAADPGAVDDASVRAIAHEVALDDQVVRAATWGTGAPAGTGWQQVQTLFMRKNSAGKVELYGQLASMTDPSPSVPSGPAPKPVTVAPASSGSWRGGQRDDYRTIPYQGDYTGGGNLRGGWFYGTAIAAACSGKTVATMRLTLTRAKGAGVNARRTVHLYLHDHTSPPAGQLTLGTGPLDTLSLSVGAKGTVTLPGSWRTALASGSARGFAIYATGPTDYMAVTGGTLAITFSA